MTRQGIVLAIRVQMVFARTTFLAAAAVCFLGLATRVVAQTAPDAVQQPATEASDAGQAKDQPKALACSRGPRTVFQAICAYVRSFHEPLPERKTDDKAEKDKETPKKEEANGDNPKPDKDSAAKGKDDKKTEDESKPKNGEKEEEKAAESSWLSAHAQATMVTQNHDVFRAPYTGPNSLVPSEPSATSLTATVFLDARLWECDGNSGELVFNPEIAGGTGLSQVKGIAGFPNGEITRVGVPEPTPYIARLYYRQTCALGDEMEKAEDEPNRIAGQRPVDRLTIQIGKLSSIDQFDDNLYSHDPRTQFLNWSIEDTASWDFPGNVRDYDYGGTIELNRKDWAIRYGLFGMPVTANSAPLDPHLLKAYAHVFEWEQRWKLDEHPGRMRLMAYANHANMGKYSEALADMPVNPDITLTRAYRFKYGFGASVQQELTKDLGLFGRLGWNDGHSESFVFTAVDRTACLGLLLKGRLWRRPEDQVGVAGVLNGLARDHRDYLAAGGLDFIIGDGQLNYGLEEILEVFYDWQVYKGIFVTADFQEVANPAYNRDRGPVSVWSLRVHIEF